MPVSLNNFADIDWWLLLMTESLQLNIDACLCKWYKHGKVSRDSCFDYISYAIGYTIYNIDSIYSI